MYVFRVSELSTVYHRFEPLSTTFTLRLPYVYPTFYFFSLYKSSNSGAFADICPLLFSFAHVRETVGWTVSCHHQAGPT